MNAQRQQWLRDAAMLSQQDWSGWHELPEGDRRIAVRTLQPLGGMSLAADVQYQTGPRFGQQLAASRGVRP